MRVKKGDRDEVGTGSDSERIFSRDMRNGYKIDPVATAPDADFITAKPVVC